jgi:predicted ATPase
MRLESISLKNFKSFQDAEIKSISPFCVVVGANGTGKTTLFDVFGFLRDALNKDVTTALQKRGGFHEVVTRGHQGEAITIEIQFRMEISDVNRLVTYHLSIGLQDGRPTVLREILRYKRGRQGKPFHFLDFQNGYGKAVTNEEDFDKQDEELEKETHTLKSPNLLAIKGLGQFQQFKAAVAFCQLIENWHVSDFHISAARGLKDYALDEHLSENGDNLAAASLHLYQNHRSIFNRILAIMQKRVPGVASVEPKETDDGRLLLRFKDGAFVDPFLDRYVSDGTLKMFAYLVLLHDPEAHPLLCVEEPENQLYPSLLVELAEEFRLYANKGGQVLVSTHSPDLLNALKINEVIWLVKRDGFTCIKRASDDPQICAYVEAGDPLGVLWKEGLFEGVDP